MSEQTSIAESVHSALSNFIAGEKSPGMVTGFIVVASSIDADGNSLVRVVHPSDQPLHLSLGLAGFGMEWIKDDVRSAFYQPCEHGDDDD